MDQNLHPQISIGDLELIGNFWVQIKEETPLVLSFQNTNLRLIFTLVEFDAKGDPEYELEVSEDKTTLTVSTKHAKKISMGGYGTKEPARIGNFGGRLLFISYLMHQFADSVFMNLALYWKKEKAGAESQNG